VPKVESLPRPAGSKQVVKSLIAIESFESLYIKGFPGIAKIL
jgi:hypothetical protein